MTRPKSYHDNSGITCGCVLAVLICNLALGGWATNYLLALLSKDIPLFWDIVIGAVGGQFLVPLAVIILILYELGVF